jgi:hypothetical protein
MTDSTNEAKSETGSGAGAEGSPADNVRQAFAGLPLDQKISTLIQVELDMLGDAVGSVVSAVSRVVDDVASACESSEPSKTATSDAGGQTSA